MGPYIWESPFACLFYLKLVRILVIQTSLLFQNSQQHKEQSGAGEGKGGGGCRTSDLPVSGRPPQLHTLSLAEGHSVDPISVVDIVPAFTESFVRDFLQSDFRDYFSFIHFQKYSSIQDLTHFPPLQRSSYP